MVQVGVKVLTGTLVGPSNPGGEPSGRAFAAGISERGPAASVQPVTSIGDYEAKYGVRTSYSAAMHDAVRCFFNVGGSVLYIARVVGAGATNASVTLLDKAAVTPISTLQVKALHPGAYGTELSVQVTAGAGTTFNLLIFRSGILVETWAGLDSPATAEATLLGSKYVRATNTNSATVAPNNNPAVLAATPLAGGSDDRATVNAASIVTAFARFGRGLGAGAVFAPGYSLDQVGVGLIAHAKANRRIAILTGAAGLDASGLKALAATITQDGKYGGLFGGWVTVSDGGTLTRLIDPAAYVAGKRAKAMSGGGDGAFAKRPAGSVSRDPSILGTSPVFDETANDDLATNRVNGIVTYTTGPELMGWFSLDTDFANYGLLSAQDALNVITEKVELGLHDQVWQDVDAGGKFFGIVYGVIDGILAPLASSGALYSRLDADGVEIDPGYVIQVDSSLQTTDQLGNNTVNAVVGVRLSPAAALIFVQINKAPLTSAL